MATSQMAKEAAQTPALMAAQLQANAPRLKGLCDKLVRFDPELVWIVGRGTSDHVGVFAKYLIEIEAGVVVSHASPSVASVYQKSIRLKNALAIFISQSGQSLDILAQVEMAKREGAFTLALVNDESSPLAQQVDFILPINAGPETAVAATKSCLLSLSALLQLVAYWKDNQVLLSSLLALPAQLQQVVDHHQGGALAFLSRESACMVLGRGLGYGISREIALKLKEVCQLHAESYSSAEFFHGPVTLAHKDFAVLDVAIDDESSEVHRQQMSQIAERGARCFGLGQSLPQVSPRLAPLVLLQNFYLDLASYAEAQGINPDAPVGLSKVTKTL